MRSGVKRLASRCTETPRAPSYRSVAAGSNFVGRVRGLRTFRRRSELRHMSTSLIAIRSPGSCSNGCSPASQPVGTVAPGTGPQRGRVAARPTSKSSMPRRSRNARAAAPLRADFPAARRSAPGADNHRRDRAEGADDDRRVGDNDLGREDPVRAMGGSTENATVTIALLANLLERGLDPEQEMLFVIDGSTRCARPCAQHTARSRPSCVRTRNVMKTVTSAVGASLEDVPV